jgi:uncharacterized protein YifE (UPF0438 family)
MSHPHGSNPANALLGQLMKRDASGETLRELIQQLATSGREVETSLNQPRTAEEQDALLQLEEAIRQGDTVLQRIWVKYHNRPVVL